MTNGGRLDHHLMGTLWKRINGNYQINVANNIILPRVYWQINGKGLIDFDPLDEFKAYVHEKVETSIVLNQLSYFNFVVAHFNNS